MSYYFGFRFGWVRVGSHVIGWYDAQVYKTRRGGVCIRKPWKVWAK